MKTFTKFLLLILFTLGINSGITIAQLQYGTPFSGVPEPSDAIIYQVNMRGFSETHNFEGVISHLDSIKNLGVNVIYLMPVYTIGTLNAVNSPYCIKDYTSVNPEFGTLADLQALVDGAHSRGMAVMFDWVANHTSWDHAWITEHKDWYKQDGSGNIVNPDLGWKDVAQLNFANADMRLALIEAMKYWVYTANCDGFRCDYADGPPADFWKQALDSLRNINTHKLLLLAEGGRNDHFDSGFDYIFGFSFYDKLKAIQSSNAPVTGLDAIITSEYAGAAESKRVVHYTTNHDVNSTGTPLDWFGGKSGSMATFLTAAYIKGVPFIYNGQEVGYPKPVDFMTSNSVIDWSLNQEMVAEYKRIIAFYISSNALRKGVLRTYSTADVCAFTKVFGNDTVIVIANLRNATKTFTYPTELANNFKYDAFTNEPINLGSSVSLSAYEYKVFADYGAVIPITDLSFISQTEIIASGATQQLVATITPVNATYKSITWVSSDTNTARVTSNGLVTGISPGTALIIAKNTNQSYADTCLVTITGIDVLGVTINKQTESISASTSSQLIATVNPVDASYKIVTWESSNPAIANVSSTGLVYGISPGNALIIANTVDNSKRDTCELTVSGIAVNAIRFNQEVDTVIGGLTLQLSYTILPADATNKNVKWQSGNTAIATVDAMGIVTGIAEGSAFIYAETEDGMKKDTCEVFVQPGNTFTVYFSKPTSWGSNIKIYYWDPLPVGILPAVNWPGVNMAYANGWYNYTFTNASFTNLIFNDGTNQTGNLVREKDGWYKDDVWYDTNPNPIKINEKNDGDFTMYPNPVVQGHNVTIKLPESFQNTHSFILVTDVLGKVMLRESINTNELTIDTGNFKTKGCYVIHITGEHERFSKLLMVR